ncbi:MAG: hypothetical protein JWN70_550 [Planctomycetaceae bacterium]|nr:hypothetical protein [Planctomycetaceae bacterium]
MFVSVIPILSDRHVNRNQWQIQDVWVTASTSSEFDLSPHITLHLGDPKKLLLTLRSSDLGSFYRGSLAISNGYAPGFDNSVESRVVVETLIRNSNMNRVSSRP